MTRRRRDVYSLMTKAERRHMREDGGCSNAAAVKTTLRAALTQLTEWNHSGPFPGCWECVHVARKVEKAGLL